MLSQTAIAVIAVIAVAALATSARADEPVDQAKQEVKTADIDYRLGRFTEALAGYTKAYELYPVPPLLFNIAQCHRNLKDYAKAIFFYEGYLRDAPAAKNRSLVEDLIRESRAALAEQDRQKPPPVEPPATPAPLVTVAPAAPLASPIQEPAPQDHRAGASRWLPPVLVGGGLAVLAGGATFYYYGAKHGSDEKYVYDDTRPIGAAMMAAGGVAIAVGAVIWLRRPSAPAVALTPGGGYVGWAGAF